MILTRDQVQALTGDADRWLDALNNALIRWEITSHAQVTMFLAQCAHESGGFKHLVENLHYSAAALLASWPKRFTGEDAVAMAYDEQRIAERAYGGRMGNGPEGSGDGFRYRGRGIIQLTGRDNYKRAGDAIGLDFVAQPELLEQPDWAASSAGWFWATNGCGPLADAGDFLAVTKRINGGTNGLADRQAWLAKVQALVPAPAVATQPAAPIEDHSTIYQPKEDTMAGSPLDAIGAIAGAINPVAGLLVNAFSPFIKDKLTKEIDRHADTPGVGAQVSDVLINKAIEITGKRDPLEAVAVARQDPVKMQAIEQSANEWLAQMAPVLDKLASIEQATWKAEEDSRAAAADRGANMQTAGPIEKNPTFIVAMIILGMVATVVFTVLWKDAIVRAFGVTDLAAFSSDMQAFVIGAIVGSALTAVIAFFFGTTRSSAAKDLTIGEFARRLPNGSAQ